MATSEIVAEMVTGIRDAIRPNKIILFGSRARGDAQFGSDFDLLIIAPSTLLAGSGHLRCTGFWPDWVCPRTSCGGRRKRSRNGAG